MPNQQHGVSALDQLVVGADRSFDLHALLRDTVRTLSNLDFEHQHEMQKLESSRTNPVLKRQIAENLRLRHRERRQPYVGLVTQLQKHLASAERRDLQAAG